MIICFLVLTFNEIFTLVHIDVEGEDVDNSDSDTNDSSSMKSPWGPFQSEMDWLFASWAVQEGIKIGSIQIGGSASDPFPIYNQFNI